jgi:hypothetical protein
MNANSLPLPEEVRSRTAMSNSTPLVTVSSDNLTLASLGGQLAVNILAGTTVPQADDEQPSIGHLYNRSRLYNPAVNQSVDFDSEINSDHLSQDLKEVPIPKISAGHGIKVRKKHSRRAYYSCRQFKVRVSVHIL